MASALPILEQLLAAATSEAGCPSPKQGSMFGVPAAEKMRTHIVRNYAGAG